MKRLIEYVSGNWGKILVATLVLSLVASCFGVL